MKKFLIILAAVVSVLAIALFFINKAGHAEISPEIAVGEEVLLQSGGTDLGASLMKPEGVSGPRPAVVMITGSGSYSFRSCWKPGVYPMWKNIAEAFLRKDYLVLFLEKKGVNRSGGHWQKQDFHDRAEDALAGIRYLKTRADVDPALVGVCGHSQGGWIAQLAAAEYPTEVAFVVCLAGPNISVKQQILDDREYELRCGGAQEETIAKKLKHYRSRLNILSSVSRIVNIGTLSHIIDYDPAVENVAARIRCPILAVYGQNDTLVFPETNIPLLEDGLKKGGRTHYQIVVLDGCSHGFIRIPSKCPDWKTIEAKMAPELIETIVAWVPFAPAGPEGIFP